MSQLIQGCTLAVPHTNRGTNRRNNFELNIDWIQFVLVLAVDKIDELCQFCFGGMQDEWVMRPGERNFCGIPWENWGQSTRGGRIYWNNDGKVLVCLPAKVLSYNDVSDVCTLIVGLVHSWDAKFTRLDACLDDYEKRLSPDLFKQAIEDRNYAGVRKALPYCPVDVSGKDLGWSFYFGSPTADKLWRYYNKAVESGGEIDAYRAEAQWRDGPAHAVALALAEAMGDEECLVQCMASLVLGAVDFVDRSDSERLDRCDRLSWWQEFIDQVQAFPLKLSAPRPSASVEKTVKHFSRCAKSFARVCASFGKDKAIEFVSHLFSEGEKRFTSIDYKLVKAAQTFAQTERTLIDNFLQIN